MLTNSVYTKFRTPSIHRELFAAKTITRYAGIVLGLYLGFALAFLFLPPDKAGQKPLMVSDFTVYWSVANLWRVGLAAQSYLEPVLRPYVLDLFPSVKGHFGWFYPPLFYLIILPFGYLPLYFPAFLPFIGLTLGLLLGALKRAVGSEIRWVIFFSSAAFWLNLLRGQNGFLTGGLMIFTILLLEQRPRLAALSLAFLTIKPQLALLLPAILLKTRAWHSLGWFIFLVSALTALSLWVLGPGIWENWLGSLSFARSLLEQDGMNSDYWYHTTSIYTFLRLLGSSSPWAYTVHFILAILVSGLCLWAWRDAVSLEKKGSLAVVNGLMISPYVMEYDLCATLVVLYWGLRFFPKRWRWLLVMLWQLPLLSSLSAAFLKVQLATPVLLLVFFVILHSAVQELKMNSRRLGAIVESGVQPARM